MILVQPASQSVTFGDPLVLSIQATGAGALSYRLAKMVIKVEYISLVNLIAGKAVVKELIQRDANADRISAELQSLLSDDEYRKHMLTEYDKIISILDTGSASENAARMMVEDLLC